MCRGGVGAALGDDPHHIHASFGMSGPTRSSITSKPLPPRTLRSRLGVIPQIQFDWFDRAHVERLVLTRRLGERVQRAVRVPRQVDERVRRLALLEHRLADADAPDRRKPGSRIAASQWIAMTGDPRVCIVSASGQNVFFAEILAAFSGALRRRGLEVVESVDHFAPPQDDLVYMFIPHEYMALVAKSAHPTPDQLRRSIALCTEQPGTKWFETVAEIAAEAGAAVDINPLGAAELRRRDVAATHVPLGYVPEWDAWGGEDVGRGLDVVFMGGYTDRRAEVLNRCASMLRGRTSRLLLVESHVPLRAGTPHFLAGADKAALLREARTLLNVHRSELAYMEWHRVLSAILNGAVLVTEHAMGTEPLVPGEHYISASAGSLPAVLEALLLDEARERAVRHAAYDLVRTSMPEAAMGDGLAEVVIAVAALPAARNGGSPAAAPVPPPRRATDYELAARNDGMDGARMALKHLVVRQRQLERDFRDLRSELRGERHVDRVEHLGPYLAHPRVSVVLTVYNYSDHVADALRSVALSDSRDIELVVVDDASTDDSVAVVRRAQESHPWLPVTLVLRGRNGGLPSARNLGISQARAEYVFMLDADNEVLPAGIRQLAETLDASPEAGFAYGTIEGFGVEGTARLVSWLDWDPARLRYGNYVDAMAMLRRSALDRVGGYADDPTLYGWEDFALWCAMAEAGITGVHVQSFVARYRISPHSMIALTTIDVSAAWATLLRRFPTLGEEPLRASGRLSAGRAASRREAAW
jgi:hypothetical protein